MEFVFIFLGVVVGILIGIGYSLSEIVKLLKEQNRILRGEDADGEEDNEDWPFTPPP